MVHKIKTEIKKGDVVILRETGDFYYVDEIASDGRVGISAEGISLWVEKDDLEKV